ncbi:uncharacterized protein B0T15DRAFT_392809 [Chaetomium strumarium]|uniref:Essential protein Yae1 N-terminal domain-containing protein n=1 Tax=Chaetomium strumarium TaxID=1170767 RepID=A0AAJ0GXC8_9PEZI|nr:hypothetical protein B0T15DRAFT_392809 [Chaetomium strumarium]
MATTTTSSPPPASTTPPSAATDPFDTLLTLEDQFYTEGYSQGLADGEVAGRTEGRQLGLERGFQKFLESGRLQGRAIVWANRLPSSKPTARPKLPGSVDQQRTGPLASPGSSAEAGDAELEDGGRATSEGVVELPPLPDNARLEKHITTLYALVESETLSTENTDEAVNDFDDRLRRAHGRAKVIERMVGEHGVGGETRKGTGSDTGSDALGQAHDPGAGPSEADVLNDV